MQNEFLRVPEFIEYYRNLSSHTSKSSEDQNLMQLIRSLLGLRLLKAIHRLTVFKNSIQNLVMKIGNAKLEIRRKLQ